MSNSNAYSQQQLEQQLLKRIEKFQSYIQIDPSLINIEAIDIDEKEINANEYLMHEHEINTLQQYHFTRCNKTITLTFDNEMIECEIVTVRMNHPNATLSFYYTEKEIVTIGNISLINELKYSEIHEKWKMHIEYEIINESTHKHGEINEFSFPIIKDIFAILQIPLTLYHLKILIKIIQLIEFFTCA